MNDTAISCPHCGSQKLFAHAFSRKIYIDHQGEAIPLLTVNFSLGNPVIEANTTTYTCSCSWSGTAAETCRLPSAP